MKTAFSIFTLVALILVFGTAYADDLPSMDTKDTGTLLHDEFFAAKDVYGAAPCVRDFSAIKPFKDALLVDAGIALYTEDYETRLAAREGRVERGAAAGGVCLETPAISDEKTIIWERLMEPSRGSESP